MLNRFTSRLLTGQPLEAVLGDLAHSLVEFFDLASCEIETVMTEPVVLVHDGRAALGATYKLDLGPKARPIGELRVALPASRGPMDQDEHTLIEGCAGQLALALESARLNDEVKRVQLDAETNRLRAALFSGVTHDIKTPLAAITAAVTSLLDGSGFSHEERLEHLETISQEAEHLNRVVNNLLDLSRLRAGVLTPSKHSAAVDELIEAVIARLQPLLKGREVSMDVKGDLPEVAMDLVQVNQVLTNLIENAVKFSPPSSPIYVSAVGSPSGARVTVADKGPGIPEPQRERIFQPFERGEGEAVGTGLGLAIARAIVVAHGGRIWAQDRPGGGAAVTFELSVKGESEDGASGSQSADR